MSLIIGRVWKYGNNINTDEIIPGKYLRSKDIQIFAAHAMEGIDPEFTKKSSGLEISLLQALTSAVGLQESRLLLP